MGDIDPKIIKKTQDTLGKIVKKPPLTDKLLARPPFRFLHDIFSSFIRSTGIMKGLFTADELVAENVKEKEAKLLFLKKIVDFLTVVNNRVPNIRISSVIAGKEADKTNFLLQMVADCVNKGINNAECVAKVLNLESEEVEMPKTEKKEKKNEPSTKPHMETAKRRSDGDRRVDHTKKSKTRTRSVELDEHAVKPAEKQKDKRERIKASSSSIKPIEKKITDSKLELPVESPAVVASPKKKTPRVMLDEIPTPPVEPVVILTPNSRPASAKRQRKPSEVSTNNSPNQIAVEPKNKLSPNTLSANLCENTECSFKEPTKVNATPNSLSAKIAENMETRGDELNSNVPTVTGMLMENQIDSGDDEDNFIIEENITGVQISKSGSGFRLGDGMTDENLQHGGLVTKLLQSKKELAGGSLMHSESVMGKDVAMGLTTVVDEAAKKRERAVTEREMERLCQALQELTRSALPLGKLMDFLQEDLESMQMEYKEWKTEEQRLAQQLKVFESRNDSNFDPIRSELLQLEEKQLEYRKAISNAKANVLQNDVSIQQMLTQVVERA